MGPADDQRAGYRDYIAQGGSGFTISREIGQPVTAKRFISTTC
jgi:hypothetical protein